MRLAPQVGLDIIVWGMTALGWCGILRRTLPEVSPGGRALSTAGAVRLLWIALVIAVNAATAIVALVRPAHPPPETNGTYFLPKGALVCSSAELSKSSVLSPH